MLRISIRDAVTLTVLWTVSTAAFTLSAVPSPKVTLEDVCDTYITDLDVEVRAPQQCRDLWSGRYGIAMEP